MSLSAIAISGTVACILILCSCGEDGGSEAPDAARADTLLLSVSTVVGVEDLYSGSAFASIEEVLLQRRQLRTNWQYDARIGFSYYFGSPFNSIVNPRFD